jgi:uncharacterized protein YlxP (DUF503 family)
VTRLVHCIKCVCVYTCLTRVNTCSTYKINKFQTKLEKYVRKIKVVLVTKNKINVSYSKISYRLEWSWSLTSVPSQSFKQNKHFKSLILEKYVRKIRVVLVTKNKINVSYSKISYRLEWSWSLTSVPSQSFKQNKHFKSLIC